MHSFSSRCIGDRVVHQHIDLMSILEAQWRESTQSAACLLSVIVEGLAQSLEPSEGFPGRGRASVLRFQCGDDFKLALVTDVWHVPMTLVMRHREYVD
ncbi:hypothetical protein ENH_00030520 [Eimeria necatrix]|uniref:Uncharacterized protein n=1 Tax=Eimeria necatrix TaxID=51315 RepID=U6MSD8_9EIME|nr:hypothetical protein ENH_00030520 [Eimeria necatrix]CDJ67107.1 hypothetical protein ENH_00030520 [Eimeria necatrix]